MDLFRKAEVLTSIFPLAGKSQQKVLIRFGGARVYGRARIVSWKGKVKTQGNYLKNVSFHGTFNPDHGIIHDGKNEAEFVCNTSGNSMNMVLDFEYGLQGEIGFESNVCEFKINLKDLTGEPQNFYQAKIDQFAEAFLIGCENPSTILNTEFSLDFQGDQEIPYFLRILQLDEGKAWTSPWYVTEEKNVE